VRLSGLENFFLEWERRVVRWWGLPAVGPGRYITDALLTLLLWILTLAFDQAWLSGSITGDPTLMRWDARYGFDDLSQTLLDRLFLGLAAFALNALSIYALYAWVRLLVVSRRTKK
jgi:hypothetical protein